MSGASHVTAFPSALIQSACHWSGHVYVWLPHVTDPNCVAGPPEPPLRLVSRTSASVNAAKSHMRDGSVLGSGTPAALNSDRLHTTTSALPRYLYGTCHTFPW